MEGKRVLLGITGSIAAYKAALLVRGLICRGAEVKVVMTPLAKQFITPLTMATLSKNPILVDFFNPENGEWNSHISLGEWADLYIVAPASANTIAKMAHGVADNLLLTTYLSVRCPVVVAPAMDLDMYAHAVTQQNIEKLRSLGVTIIEPTEGELASGLSGKGRMAEPEEIIEQITELLQKKNSLNNRHFLVTAGATVEAIDPVRYISNHSTGKMGYAIAGELCDRGAKVTLVSGRTNLPCPKGVKRVDVLSAEQMYDAAMECWAECDGAVMCAAVADYTPEKVSDKKIKKSDGNLKIELKRTRDIAAEMGETKGRRILAGFALETDNGLENAKAKLERKNFDFIVLNSCEGFGGDDNEVAIVTNSEVQNYPPQKKTEIAKYIADTIEKLL